MNIETDGNSGIRIIIKNIEINAREIKSVFSPDSIYVGKPLRTTGNRWCPSRWRPADSSCPATSCSCSGPPSRLVHWCRSTSAWPECCPRRSDRRRSCGQSISPANSWASPANHPCRRRRLFRRTVRRGKWWTTERHTVVRMDQIRLVVGLVFFNENILVLTSISSLWDSRIAP